METFHIIIGDVCLTLYPTGDVNRHWGVGNAEEMKLRNSLLYTPLADLRRRWVGQRIV